MTARPPRSMTFTSRLASSIEAYLRMKEALGRRYAAERTILRALDAFLTTIDDDLTSDTFVAWNATLARLTPGVRRNWLRVAQSLSVSAPHGPDVFVPDPTGFPKPHAPIRPYIFTTTDIARLLDAADHLVATSRSPLRRETFRLAIVLLYTSGLRRGELVRLTVGDYEPSEQTLLIRASKFHKSRRLPRRATHNASWRRIHALGEIGASTASDSALIWIDRGEAAARIRVKRCDARSTRSSAPWTFAHRPAHGRGSTTSATRSPCTRCSGGITAASIPKRSSFLSTHGSRVTGVHRVLPAVCVRPGGSGQPAIPSHLRRARDRFTRRRAAMTAAKLTTLACARSGGFLPSTFPRSAAPVPTPSAAIETASPSCCASLPHTSGGQWPSWISMP